MLPDLFILAGGAGSRMGQDKLQLRSAAGRLLILDWFGRLKWPTLPTLVLPPDRQAPPELATWPTLHDSVSGEGPLRGVATALAAATADAADWLLITAVDMPGIGREQLDFVAARREVDVDGRLWMTRRAEGIEPFPLLIHREMASAVHARLAAGRRSLHGLAEEAKSRVIDAPPQWPGTVWRNLNRQDDLEAYQRDSSGSARRD